MTITDKPILSFLPLSCTAAAKFGCDVGGITPAGLGNAGVVASMWFVAAAAPDDGEELLGVAFEGRNLLLEAAVVAAATAAATVLYPLAAPA